VLRSLEDRFLFRPISSQSDWEAPPNALVRDIEWPLPDGTRIHAWWCPTPDWEPGQGAALYFHGNGGNLSHRGDGIVRWQQELGVAVLIPDYSGYGRSTGRPTEAGCYAAADAAYDWLVQTMRVPPERILLYGGSLGGAVAIDLASRRPHRALVVVSPFSSFRDMARKTYPWLPRGLVSNRFDNLAKIGRCRRAFLLAHGTADRMVPFAQAERLFAAANEPKHFFAMTDYDHHHTPGPEFYARLREFLAENPAPEASRA
jgi:fermentation-respiration switch protein FrsA (DUF1100 family)